MCKKTLCLLVVFALLSCFAFFVGAEEVTHSGNCGENATWQFCASTQTLTISGTGPMADEDTGIWTWVDYKSQIRHLVVEEGITTIGKNAFYYLDDLRSAKIANSVKRIEENAFSTCWRMQSIQLPNALQYIGKYAFESCSGLTDFAMPDSVTECGPGAFESCSGLKSITLSKKLSKLPYDMLSNCSNLTSITIPASVKEMESWGPGWGNVLSNIVFKGDAPRFSANAFDEVTAVVRYPANNSTWTEDKRQNYGGNLTWVPDGEVTLSGTFGNNNKLSWKLEKGTLTISGNGWMDGWSSAEQRPWHPYRGMIKKVVLAGKIENIYAYAFADCSELTEVVWASTITSIHEGAFRYCTSLKTITIPDTVTYIYDGVFFGCTALKSVTLSRNLKELGSAAFGECTSLKSVTIPASVKKLWRWVFMDSAVKSVYFQGDMPKLTGEIKSDGVFLKMDNAIVYYPENNRTWTVDKIKSEADIYKGEVKFVASAELNQTSPNQKPADNTQPTTGGNPTNTEPSDTTTNTVPDTLQQTTATTESVTTVPSETTQPTEGTGETTVSTTPENGNNSDEKGSATWIVWTLLGVVAVAGSVTGTIGFKKWRKKNK